MLPLSFKKLFCQFPSTYTIIMWEKLAGSVSLHLHCTACDRKLGWAYNKVLIIYLHVTCRSLLCAIFYAILWVWERLQTCKTCIFSHSVQICDTNNTNFKQENRLLSALLTSFHLSGLLANHNLFKTEKLPLSLKMEALQGEERKCLPCLLN